MRWGELRRGDVIMSDSVTQPSQVRLVLTVVDDEFEEEELWVMLTILDLQTGRVKEYARRGELPERYIVLPVPS